MRWADKDLEELASIYWEEIAPKFRADGHDPESEYPSYDWLVSNGYRGFRYPFHGAHDSYDLSLAEFFREYLDLAAADGEVHTWPGDDQATHEALDQFLEAQSDSLTVGTIKTYRYQLSTLLGLYRAVHDDVEIVRIIANGPEAVKAKWHPVFVRLNTELSSKDSKDNHARILERFYSFHHYKDETNPIAELRSKYKWQDHTHKKETELSAENIIDLYTNSKYEVEQLVILLTAIGRLSTKECASLETSAIHVDEGQGLFSVALPDQEEQSIPAVLGSGRIQRRVEKNNYVFPSNEAGRSHVTAETIRRWFREASKRAGITVDGRTPTPRDLRMIPESTRQKLIDWGKNRVKSGISGGELE